MFLQDDDINHIERNEWSEAHKIKTQLPMEKNLYRFKDFALHLRSNPKTVAFILMQTKKNISRKLRKFFGSGSQVADLKKRHVVQETIIFSLYGNMFVRGEFSRFCDVFQYVLELEMADCESLSTFLSIDPEEDSVEDTSLIHTGTDLVLTHLLQGLTMRYGVTSLKVAIGAVVGDLVISNINCDPSPSAALNDQKTRQKTEQQGDSSSSSSSASSSSTGPVVKQKRLSVLQRMRSGRSKKSDASDLTVRKDIPIISTQATKKLIEGRQKQLSLFIESCVSDLSSLSKHRLAWQLKYILHFFLTSCGKRYGEKEIERERAGHLLGQYLFLGYLKPVLLNPSLSGLYSEVPTTSTTDRSLSSALSVLRKIFCGGQFSSSSCFSFSNPLISRLRPVVSRWLESLADECLSLPPLHIGNEIDAGSICLSLAELASLHQILFTSNNWSEIDSSTELKSFEKLPNSGLKDELMRAHYQIPIGNVFVSLPQIKDTGVVIRKLIQSSDCEMREKLLIQLLARLFLRLSDHYLTGIQKECDLSLFLQHTKAELLIGLDGDFDSISDSLTLLHQIQHVLSELKEEEEEKREREKETNSTNPSSSSSTSSSSLSLSPSFSSTLLKTKEYLLSFRREMYDSHRSTWDDRQRELRLGVENARQHIKGMKVEFEYKSAVLFNKKTTAFIRSAQIPCRLQLPPQIKLRKTHTSSSLSSPSPSSSSSSSSSSLSTSTGTATKNSMASGGDPSNNEETKRERERERENNTDTQSETKGPLFYCSSVETFISEFTEYSHSLREHPNVARDVLHFFLRLTKERCEGDSTFSENEVAKAMELVESYLCSKLFPFLFSPSLSKMHDFLSDDKFFGIVYSMHWVTPEHLDLADMPRSDGFWEPVTSLLQELDDLSLFRSPKAKLERLTMCVKWIVKVVQTARGDSGTDADTSLSALIYTIVKAQPRTMPSTLFYVESFRPEEKMNGEDGYCLTQFNLAMRFISDSLQNMRPKSAMSGRKRSVSMVGGSGCGGDGDGEFGSGSLLQTLLATPRIRSLIVSFCSTHDLANNVRLVSKQWHTLSLTNSLLPPSSPRQPWRRPSFLRPSLSVSSQPTVTPHNLEDDEEVGRATATTAEGKGKEREREGERTGEELKISNDMNLKEILAKESLCTAFIDYCTPLNAAQLPRFYIAVENFKDKLEGTEEQKRLLFTIYNTYVKEGALSLVYLSSPIRANITTKIAQVLGLRDVLERERNTLNDEKGLLGQVEDDVFEDPGITFPVRVILPLSVGGGHVTIRCNPTMKVCIVKERVLETLRKRQSIGDHIVADQFFLRRSDDEREREREISPPSSLPSSSLSSSLSSSYHRSRIPSHSSTSFSMVQLFNVDDIVHSSMELSPIEVTMETVPQETAPDDLKRLERDLSLASLSALEETTQLLEKIGNIPIEKIFDEAQNSVFQLMQVSHLDNFLASCEVD